MEHARDLVEFPACLAEVVLREVAEVASEDQQVLQLGGGALGDVEEASVVACVDSLRALAQPVIAGRQRVPGIKLHDDRVIRLLDTLLYTGGLLGDWTTADLHARLLERHRLIETDYTISQLRYDLRKLRAHGLAERIGRSRRYRLTTKGVRIGVVLVKSRHRLLGPIFAPASVPANRRSNNPSDVEAALRSVDKALDTLCKQVGLRIAA